MLRDLFRAAFARKRNKDNAHGVRGLLGSTAGESIVEALAATLILSLTLLFFVTTIKTATDLSFTAREKYTDYRAQTALAEAGPWTEDGTVTIGTEDVAVLYSSGSAEDGVLSYRLDTSADEGEDDATDNGVNDSGTADSGTNDAGSATGNEGSAGEGGANG